MNSRPALSGVTASSPTCATVTMSTLAAAGTPVTIATTRPARPIWASQMTGRMTSTAARTPTLSTTTTATMSRRGITASVQRGSTCQGVTAAATVATNTSTSATNAAWGSTSPGPSHATRTTRRAPVTRVKGSCRPRTPKRRDTAVSEVRGDTDPRLRAGTRRGTGPRTSGEQLCHPLGHETGSRPGADLVEVAGHLARLEVELQGAGTTGGRERDVAGGGVDGP